MHKSESESAVSEVVGVILVVALTVIMAAIIAAYSFGMIPSIPISYVIAFTVSQVGNNEVQVVYHGGPDQAILQSIDITWPSGIIEHIVQPKIGTTYIAINQGSGMNATPGRDHIIITGHFPNNIDKVLLETEV